MIAFNVPEALIRLETEREVYTWRQAKRPTGRQVAFTKGRRIGIVVLHRLPQAQPEQYAHYFNRAGFKSWPDWKKAAENSHKCPIKELRLYHAHFEGETCYQCKTGDLSMFDDKPQETK